MNKPISHSILTLLLLLGSCFSFHVKAQGPCIDPAIIDPGVFCITIYDPVCGCDGQTYSNACVAENHHGVTAYTSGPCQPGCDASFTYSLDPNGLGVQFNSHALPNSSATNGVQWDFGDGTTANKPDPHHIYSSQGTYIVCLTVRSWTGNTNTPCIAIECDTIVVGNNTACIDPSLIDQNHPCPLAFVPVCGCDGNTYDNACEATYYHGVTSFTPGPCHSGCQASFSHTTDASGLGVDFINTSVPNANTPGVTGMFSWDFGDGHSANVKDPFHAYSTPGTYLVCLTVTAATANGTTCTDTWCDSITVAQSTCVDLSVIDSNLACTMIYDPVCGCDGHTYGNSCVALHHHGVTHWTQGPCGSQNCQASFTHSQSSSNAGIQFTNTSSPNLTNHNFSSLWDFGDGTVSNVSNPTHVFQAPGVYYVCLTITTPNSAGAVCTDTYCDSVRVGPVPSPCRADFGYSYGIVPPTVFFYDQSASHAATWLWDFGDGSSSTLQNPSHIFPTAGSYVVCLTVTFTTSPTGPVCTDTYCDTVIAPGCVDPTLIDTTAVCLTVYDPVCGCDSITYSNSCVAEKYHGITSWRHGACTAPCEADFSVSTSSNSNTVHFFNDSKGNYHTVFWRFGDGATSTKRNPVHEYSVTGWYRVCLTIFGAGCVDQYCDSVYATGCTNPSQVNPQVVCPMVYQPVCGCDGHTYNNRCVAQYRHGVTSWKPGPCPGSGYCPSHGVDQGKAWISQVGPNNSGDDGGYAFFNYCSSTLQSGNTYVIPVKGVAVNPAPGTKAHWRIWIDFNHDNDFDDPGELAWQAYGGLNLNAVVTIPYYACAGCTRARVQLSDHFTDACGFYSIGETEDYDVRIKSNHICHPANNTGNIHKTGDESEDMEGEPFAGLYEPVKFSLYPNPASDHVILSLMTEEKQVAVRVFDISGKLVIDQQVETAGYHSSVQLSTGHLPNGIYQVEVQSNGYREIKKLVVTR